MGQSQRLELPHVASSKAAPHPSLQKTSLFSTLYFQGSPKKVQTDAENRLVWLTLFQGSLKPLK